MPPRILSRSVRRIIFGIVLGLSAATQAAATVVDLTSGTTGTVFPNQSFSDETRAANVVLGSVAFTVESMTLNHVTIAGVSATVGARIYDGSGTLIASANAVVGSGADQSVTIPVFASLAAYQTYWVAFHVSTGGVVNVIDPTPAGLAVTPYAPTAGYFTVTASGSAPGDAFPSPANSFIPLNMTVTGAPDPDGDGDQDGIADSEDNCPLVPNGPLQLDVGGHSQLDTDGDGYGNLCDADINNSGLTTTSDYTLLRNCLNLPASTSAQCAAADMNGSGLVTVKDYTLLRNRLNTAPGPSAVCVHGGSGTACPWQAGDLVTCPQVQYGGLPGSVSCAALLNAQFANVYGANFQVGIPGTSGFSLIFTSATALLAYLPSSGTAAALNADLANTTSSASGVFGGDVAALKLNVDFSDADVLGGSADVRIGDLTLCVFANTSLNNISVRTFLGIANTALGGGSTGFAISELDSVAADINLAFLIGVPSTFAVDHLVNGACH